jgi:hypothetical protein
MLRAISDRLHRVEILEKQLAEEKQKNCKLHQ